MMAEQKWSADSEALAEKICHEATSGPWFVNGAGVYAAKANAGEYICVTDDVNDEFIASARTLLPAAMAEIQRLRDALSAMMDRPARPTEPRRKLRRVGRCDSPFCDHHEWHSRDRGLVLVGGSRPYLSWKGGSESRSQELRWLAARLLRAVGEE